MKEKMVTLDTGVNYTNNGPQHTIKEIAECDMIPQQIRPTEATRQNNPL